MLPVCNLEEKFLLEEVFRVKEQILSAVTFVLRGDKDERGS